MNSQQKLKSFLLYDGLSREDYNAIAADMHEQNRRNLSKYTLVMSILFAALLIATFFLDSIAVNRIPYLIALLFSLLTGAALATIAKNNISITLILNYLFCTAVLLFCIYIGTYTAKDQLATSFCVALAILPFVAYDIVLRSILFRILMCSIFVMIDIRVKNFEFVSRDIVNMISYGVLGTVMSALFQRSQAEGAFLKGNMNKAIRQQTTRITELGLQSITAMAAAIDAKDPYTKGHSIRVAKYAAMIAQAMGKPKEEQERISSIAMLHDIGKIGIPDTIINKPSQLTKEEYEIIKTHPAQGYEILRKIDVFPDIAIGAHYHHERYDGKGYPEGLCGDAIPEIARIIAVADAYDAMTSTRSYRKAMNQKEVFSEIQNGMGTQFDPKIAGFMLDIMLNDKNYTLHS